MDPNERLDRFARRAWFLFVIVVLVIPGAAVLQIIGVI
jgi:hypothetical protein